jgi:hypothetical protein
MNKIHNFLAEGGYYCGYCNNYIEPMDIIENFNFLADIQGDEMTFKRLRRECECPYCNSAGRELKTFAPFDWSHLSAKLIHDADFHEYSFKYYTARDDGAKHYNFTNDIMLIKKFGCQYGIDVVGIEITETEMIIILELC